ncbi:class I SAM-dependent methyltransferase [Flavobacteriaceae bacterium]|nr:class I SAM-dependent methyltransferase [Flavobacteriaceae bacterium]
MDYSRKPEDYFSHQRVELLEFLPEQFSTVLDVGCGEGSFLKLLQGENRELWGIELIEKQAKKAKETFKNIFSGPVEDNLSKLPENHFDVVFFNDVLEHLSDPYSVLEQIKKHLKKDGVVISSIPNIRYHSALMSLLFKKDWKYESHGIMDKTHLRFFTNKSIVRMYEEAGYSIISHKGINLTRSLKPWLYNIPLLFTALDMRILQYATLAKKNS